MKSIRIILAATCLILASCGDSATVKADENNGTMNDSTQVGITAQVVNTKDPVCGMAIMADHLGDTASYNGSVYGFCSEKCKDEFMKDPATYAANAK